MTFHSQPRRRLAREAGYSLIEILVVMAIIGSLAALVGPRLLGQVDKSKMTTAKVQIKMFETALTNYYTDSGMLPASTEELQVLVENTTGLDTWQGPYLDADEPGVLPLDPWGAPYQYEPPVETGSIGTVMSLGADKAPGGTGANKDIR